MTAQYDFSSVTINAAQLDFERNRCFSDEEIMDQNYLAQRYFECEECNHLNYCDTKGNEPEECQECGCPDLYPESKESWSAEYHETDQLPI